MRITVTVKPGSKSPGIEQNGETLIVRVRDRAIEGPATEAVIRAIAEYYKVAPSRITLVRGATSRIKVVEIN